MRSIRILLLFLFGLAVYWSFESQLPREKGLWSIPKEEFDLERAMDHVRQMAREPHGVGFPAHETVKDYLVSELQELGLEVELQTGYTSGDWGNVSEATNILTRIDGTNEDGKDLLLLSHYDSHPHSSFGASDAASGVATILEGIRSFLAKGKKPWNDIVVVFTDSEELGLNGASLFANAHPWSDNIGLVLNFEARGSGGPGIMLVETNRGNEKLIREFDAAGVRFPVGNSLAYSVYKMLPNDTDLTVFREDRDIDGFNFAFVDDHFDYHTAMDTAERLDIRTLAHQASYLVPLLRHFSETDISDLKSPNDQVYYNMPYYGLVCFSFDLIWPLYFAAILFFGLVLAFGIREKKLNGKEIVKGVLPLLGSLLVNGVLGAFAWKVLNGLYPGYQDMLHGFTYNGHTYIYALIALALSACFFLYNRFYALKSANLLVAPILFWLVVLGLLARYLPGASYFVLPVFALIAGFLISMDQDKPNLPFKFVLTLPAVFILAPLIYMFPVGLGLKLLASTTVLVTLTFAATLPYWHANKMMTRLGVFSLAAGLFFLAKAHLQSNFTEDRPKPSSLLYVQDIDSGESHWATYDRVLHEWNEKYFVPDRISEGTVQATVISSKYNTGFNVLARAENREIPGPEIRVTRDTVIDSQRYLSVTIRPNRPVNRLDLYASGKTILEGSVNGAELDPDYLKRRTGKDGFSRLFTHYISRNAPTQLYIKVPAGQKDALELQLYESSNDLIGHPRLGVDPRPVNTIPMPFVLNDAVVVSTKFTID